MLRLESERLSRWSEAMAATSHAVIHFEGRVQGVGFRYQTLRVAQEFEVSGYVQNLADGRVCLEAEGQRPESKRYRRHRDQPIQRQDLTESR